MNQPTKRALVISDLSAIGRVSAMTSISVLSAAGIHTSCLPTALLSTHSGEFQDFSFLELTDEMKKILTHWQSLSLRFDAILTGYLGSPEQAAVVLKALELAKDDALILVDPVMADHGRLYSKITPSMVDAMKQLCKKASILVPNLTEAAFLLDRPYEAQKDDTDYAAELARALCERFSIRQVVLTGISSSDQYGALCYDRSSDKSFFFGGDKVDDHFYGTGDLFASVLAASLLNEKSLKVGTELATEFTYRTIKMSYDEQLERRYGVCFEKNIGWLSKQLGE